jgi:hypothetical protein
MGQSSPVQSSLLETHPPVLLLIFSALSSRWPLQRRERGHRCGFCAQIAVWLYKQKVRWFCVEEHGEQECMDAARRHEARKRSDVAVHIDRRVPARSPPGSGPCPRLARQRDTSTRTHGACAAPEEVWSMAIR